MTDKKISPHIERFKTLQDYAQYFIDEKGKTPNVSCVDEPVEVVKFAEQKVHPDYIRTGNDTYNVVVYDDYDYTSPNYITPNSQVCTQSILYKFLYDSNTGAYAQYDFITAPTPSPSNGIKGTLQYIYPSKIFEDFEGTITRSVNLDRTTEYNATTKASYKAIHRTLGNKDINIFQISCASETVALNEKIEFPGGHMYYPSPVYTIESMNDDVVLDDGFLFGGHTHKIIKQDDRHFILGLDDKPLSNNRFDLPAILIPFHYKDLPELTFFKYFDEVNLPVLTEEKPQAEFEFYLNIYDKAQKVEANDLVYKQYNPGFNVTYVGKKLYAEYIIDEIDDDNKMLGSVELDGSALEQEIMGYRWTPYYLTSGAHELVAYDGEHNEIGRMTFNVKMPQFDYVLYDNNKNVIEQDEISRYVIDESKLNNDYLIGIHGVCDGKMYQGVPAIWADENMYNEEITDWRGYIVLSPIVNNHNLEAYYEPDAAGASELFKLKPSWLSSDTRYNIMDESNNIAEICFYYEIFQPYLENGNITVENLNFTRDYYNRPYKYYDTDNIYFYHVYGKNQRQQVFLSELGGNNYFNATYDTNNFWRYDGGQGEHKIGWIINPEVDLPIGDYKVTNAYVQYEGLRLDLWDEITFSVSEPYLENGNITVDNLKQIPSYRKQFGIYYDYRNDYFYSVDKYGNRTQTSVEDALLNATFDTSIIEPYSYYGDIGWCIKSGLEVHSGDYEVTNAYLTYNELRLDLWDSANITVVNQTSYVAKNENDETIDPGQNLNWTYDANGVLTSEPFKFIKHNFDDTPVDANITQDVNYIIYNDNEGLYDFTLFNVEVTRVNNNEYFVVKYTPKAELQTVRNYRVPWIDFTYNNNLIKYISNDYVPQSGPMQIYIADAAAIDSMDQEIHSFTSSATDTLTYDTCITYCDDPNYQGESVVQTITTTGTGITVEYPYTELDFTGFKLTLQPNASGTITIAYQKSPDTDFVPAARTYNITAPQSTNTDYLDYKAPTEGGWGNRKLYGIDNNVDSSNGTYEFAIFDESGANHTFNYTLGVQGNAEIKSTTTTDAGDPRGEGLVLIYKIAISGQASITFSVNDTPYVAVRFNM